MSELIIFEDDQQPVEVRLEGETVWLMQAEFALRILRVDDQREL